MSLRLDEPVVAGWMAEIASRVGPWLPPWLSYVCAAIWLPLGLLAWALESLIRILVTPQKYWEDR